MFGTLLGGLSRDEGHEGDNGVDPVGDKPESEQNAWECLRGT